MCCTRFRYLNQHWLIKHPVEHVPWCHIILWIFRFARRMSSTTVKTSKVHYHGAAVRSFASLPVVKVGSPTDDKFDACAHEWKRHYNRPRIVRRANPWKYDERNHNEIYLIWITLLFIFYYKGRWLDKSPFEDTHTAAVSLNLVVYYWKCSVINPLEQTNSALVVITLVDKGTFNVHLTGFYRHQQQVSSFSDAEKSKTYKYFKI